MNIKNHLLYWILTYPAGILLGILFQILRFFGRVEVKNWHRFPRWQGNLLIVSNHPSLWEPLLLAALLFRQYLVSPKYGPWSAPDSENYQKKWYCFPVKPRFIPVERGNKKAEICALNRMANILRAGEILILHPEGGRTGVGDSFLYSKKGNRIRKLQNGVGILVKKANPTIIPVWVSGSQDVWPIGKRFPRFWKKTTIKIGVPIGIGSRIQNNIVATTELVSKELLGLSDE